MVETKPQTGMSRRKVRALRSDRATALAPEVMVGELETHYRRLTRVQDGNVWKRAFGGLSALLGGGVVGALLTGTKWSAGLVGAAVAAAVSVVAWYGIRDTEAESIAAIRADYKKDIIDSIEFVEEGEAVEEMVGPSRA